MSETVLVMGASGWLGGQITRELIQAGLRLRVGLRGGTSHDKAAEFDGSAEVVAADLHDADTLASAVRDVHTIVSVIQGGEAELVDGQVALARAGLDAGVERILPSDYSIEFRGVSTDRHLFLGWRAEADRRIAELGLPQANIMNGTFTEMLRRDFFGMVDVDGSHINFYGDPDQPYDFTATPDVAKFAAQVVKDFDRLGPQMVHTDRLSARQLAETASMAFDKPFELHHLGDIAQLDRDLAERQAANPDDPMAWIALQYQRMMATAEGFLALPISTHAITTPRTVKQFLAGSGTS